MEDYSAGRKGPSGLGAGMFGQTQQQQTASGGLFGKPLGGEACTINTHVLKMYTYTYSKRVHTVHESTCV